MKFVWWALISGLVLVGCGEDKDEDDEAASALIGTWESACVADEDSYSMQSYVYTATSMTAGIGSWTDSKCTTPQMAAEIKGTYKEGEDASSTTATADATPLDITVTSATLVFLTADIVSGVNEDEGCTETVVIDTALDASKCEALFDGDGLPAVGSVLKTIYKIDGKNLSMGEDDVEDANGRENTFDSTVYVNQ